MNLIMTCPNFETQHYAIYESEIMDHVVVKSRCPGCDVDIIRIFKQNGTIQDCKLLSLSSIYDGVICHNCLKYYTKYNSPAAIFNQFMTHKTFNLKNLKTLIVENSKWLERMQAYLEKVAECQIWESEHHA